MLKLQTRSPDVGNITAAKYLPCVSVSSPFDSSPGSSVVIPDARNTSEVAELCSMTAWAAKVVLMSDVSATANITALRFTSMPASHRLLLLHLGIYHLRHHLPSR